MKKETLITSVLTITSIFTSMFMKEIKDLFLNADWHWYLFVFGCCMGIYTILSVVIRWLFKRNYNELYSKLNEEKDNEINNISKEKEEIQKRFQESIDTYLTMSRINFAVCRDMFINTDDEEEIKKIAKVLYSFYKKSGITIPEWEKWGGFGISPEVIKEMKKISLWEENKELDKK